MRVIVVGSSMMADERQTAEKRHREAAKYATSTKRIDLVTQAALAWVVAELEAFSVVRSTNGDFVIITSAEWDKRIAELRERMT